MKRHAKAPSAGSIEGSDNSRGLFRRAFATRGASFDSNGTGAPAIARLCALLALAFVVVLAFGASSALAGYVTTKTFSGPGTANGQLEEPGRAVIEASTGNLFVADGGNDRVQVFDPEGQYLTQFSTGLSKPFGLALYESGGQTVLYVSNAGNDTIAKFDSDEAAVPAFTPAAGFTSPAPGGGAGEVGDFEAAIATDPTNGDLLLADQGNHRVSRYQPNGSFLSSFDGADSGAAFTYPLDLAIDSTGDVLVVDSTGTLVQLMRSQATSRLERFSSTGVSEGPIGAGHDRPGLVAIDPDNNDVIVMSHFTASVLAGDLDIIAPDGTPVSSAKLSTSFGIVTGLAARGAGSGRIYAITGLEAGGSGLGAIGGQILEDVEPPTAALEAATDVAQFSATLHGRVNPHGTETKYHFEYSTDFGEHYLPVGPDQSAGAGNGDVAVSAALAGLPDNFYIFFRLIATNPGGGETTPEELFLTLDAEVPAVTLGAATEITKTGATLHGTVDAEGVPTTYRFEYSTDDGASWTPAPVPDASAGEGADPVDVQTTITVDPNSVVRYRLAAKNGAGTTTTPDQALTTLQDAPGVVTGAASNREATTATLHGTVNPFGLQSNYHFEYGTTTAYGSRVPLGNEAVAGNGHKAMQVSHGIIGLAPETTYHFRLVATNSIGEAQGEDHTFSTAVVAPENRAYELVSPADKGGGNVLTSQLFQASPDGNVLVFAGKGTLNTGQAPLEASPEYPRYLARRGASGWSPFALDPPMPLGQIPPFITAMMGVSEDGTKAVVMSTKSLAEGAVDGDTTVYLRDIATGTYTTIATTPGIGLFLREISYLESEGGTFVGGNSDFSHVLLYGDQASFLPGAPPSALYEWSDGQLSLASVAPDGSPLSGMTSGKKLMLVSDDPRFVSEDGSTIALAHAYSTEAARPGGPIWVRIDGATTLPVSASQRSVDAGTMRDAGYAGMTRDGNFVFILSRDLTDDSPAGVIGLYRFDVDSGELTWLTQTGNALTAGSWLQTTDDGTVFTRSGGGFDVWRNGHVSHVANAGVGTERIASANGRFFVFRRAVDNQIYRYDVEAETLTCASCLPDGTPGGDPRINFDIGTFPAGGLHTPQAVDNSGHVFFDTLAPLVPTDANSTRDVYSFDGDQVTLISGGAEFTESQFADATPDGKNIYFTTNDRLVKVDTDRQIDVYDARVGGGIAAQNPPQPRGECIRDDCKATPGAGPELPFGGSEGLSGPGNVKAAAGKRCGKGRHSRMVKGKSRCVKSKQHKRANSNRRQAR